MHKEATKVIREQRKKEKEETKKKRAIDSQNIINRVVQRLIMK
jgi:hypothetical protein